MTPPRPRFPTPDSRFPNMLFSRPTPFREALDFLRAKGLLPTTATSAQLARLPAAIRAAAQFSATVANADYLQQIQSLIDQSLSAQTDAPRIRLALRDALRALSYDPYAEPGVYGTIKDLSSDQRLDLIIRMQTQFAQAAGKRARDLAPAALDAAPAQELFRLEDRAEPRPWPQRWAANGGQFYGGGRMIALKTDPVWENISAFGQPYPPFDFNSGMWVRDILRPEALALGAIPPDYDPAADLAAHPTPESILPPQKASAKTLSAALLQAVLDAVPGASASNGILSLA